jgi:hypothetical protein
MATPTYPLNAARLMMAPSVVLLFLWMIVPLGDDAIISRFELQSADAREWRASSAFSTTSTF